MEQEKTPTKHEMRGRRSPETKCQSTLATESGASDNDKNANLINGSMYTNVSTDQKAHGGCELDMGGSVVELNVGGSFYTTTVNTLERCRYFHVLVSGPFCQKKDKAGRIFIDRNG